MRLWQATWDFRKEFLIWGEYAGAAAKLMETTEHPDSERHPFASSAEQLAEDIDLLEYEADELLTIKVRLPSDDLGPLPSPKLLLPEELPRSGEVRLQTWEVPAISLRPRFGIMLLTSLPHTPPQGLHFDDSFLYWVEATKLLLELLTRGRFLPGIVSSNGSFESVWNIVPTDDFDSQRLRILAENMPPICRSLDLPGGKTPQSSVLLESFIAGSADELIRMFLRSMSLLDYISEQRRPQGSTLSDWLESLCRYERETNGPAYELTRLSQRLSRWNQTFTLSQSHSLKTLFRLHAPQQSSNTESQNWDLEILVQSANDPSQEVSAKDILSGEIGFLRFSHFTVEELESQLLRDLGNASKLFSPLERVLGEANPTRASLSAKEAHSFLRYAAPLFEESGFKVELPQWWNEPSARLGLKLNIGSEQSLDATPTSASLLGMDRLVDFSWEVSLGERTLSVNDFRQLVQQQIPLVQVEDKWIELKPEEISQAVQFLDQQKEKSHISLVDALKFSFDLEQSLTGLPVVEFSASGWVEKLINSNMQTPAQAPAGFIGELRHYQLDGLSWLSFLSQIGCGACLADDMGLGKTIQLLALLQLEKEQTKALKEEGIQAAAFPTLLIVPMSILDNWQQEVERFTPTLSTYIHHGSSRVLGEDFRKKVNSTDIVLTTYSLAHRDEELLKSVRWSRIALDEAQNIKNLATKQTKAVRRIAYEQLTTLGSEYSFHRLALTGTPLENHLEELWSIFDFLNPGYLGSIGEFRQRFSAPIERYRSTEAAEMLSKVVSPFVLRRVKTNPAVINDLPEKIEMPVLLSLTEEQAALYQNVLESMMDRVDQATGIQRKGLVLASITKLKQVCNHPALFLKDDSSLADRSTKLSRLDELIEVILAEGDKTLIFTQYAQMGHLLKPYLQERFGVPVSFMHGAVPKNKRTQMVNHFQSDEGPPIFVLSLKVGGLGLNLTAANQIIHFDQWWNPAVEQQATDRAYRIGQKRAVQVRKFICRGTLEEKIASMLEQKKELADRIVGSTKSLVTQMSTEDLKELLSLTKQSD